MNALPQWSAFVKRIEDEMRNINDILLDMTGSFGYVNCSEKCLTWLSGVPANVESGHHKTTVFIVMNIEGFTIHPIGVQFTLNMDSVNPDEWFVEYVWFQGQHFKNFTEVRIARNRNKLNIHKVPVPKDAFGENLASSLNFRGSPRPSAPLRGPRSFMPDGKRFIVSDRHVRWMGWEFEFSMLTSLGIQLHNVHFLKERIAWELGVQEITVFYSAGSPALSHTTYYDSFTVLGLRVSELFPGIDCPEHAQFFDFVHLQHHRPRVYKNGACLFEHDQGIPLRRHYEGDDFGPYHYMQGMPDNVLVFRHILSVYNYDYIVDFMFHQAGQIEGKVSLSGYLLSSYYTGPEMNKYGHVLNQPSTIGVIHHHLVNIKADLDIKGQKNRFETLDIHLETIKDDITEGQTLLNRYFNHSLKRSELEAAYNFNFSTPKYLIMYNENEKNKFGNSRGYRILSEGMSKVLLPDDYRGSRSRAWTKHQVAVTKHSDNECCSSSIYASAEPFDPVMSFADYINDDEDIVDQDLVAWITLGTHHIPHSEDVPIVNSPGVQLTFHLLPYNYFDEDPSLASRDNVRVTPGENGHVYKYSGVPEGDVTDSGEGSTVLAGGGFRHQGLDIVPSVLCAILIAYLHLVR